MQLSEACGFLPGLADQLSSVGASRSTDESLLVQRALLPLLQQLLQDASLGQVTPGLDPSPGTAAQGAEQGAAQGKSGGKGMGKGNGKGKGGEKAESSDPGGGLEGALTKMARVLAGYVLCHSEDVLPAQMARILEQQLFEESWSTPALRAGC